MKALQVRRFLVENLKIVEVPATRETGRGGAMATA
jgi:hypothetical protein